MLRSEFSNEKDLQNWLKYHLLDSGIACQDEVVMSHDRRADLVTSDSIIECKHRLNSSALYQAYGQASMYAAMSGRQRLIIVGQPPPYADRATTQNTALALQSTDDRLSVYWLTPAGVTAVGQKRSSVLDRLSNPWIQTPTEHIPHFATDGLHRERMTRSPIQVIRDRKAKPPIALDKFAMPSFWLFFVFGGLAGGIPGVVTGMLLGFVVALLLNATKSKPQVKNRRLHVP